MRITINEAARGWFIDYHSAAVAANVPRGHRVARPPLLGFCRSDGWVTYDEQFDRKWFADNGFKMPQMFQPEQVEEHAIDYGGGLSRIEMRPKGGTR